MAHLESETNRPWEKDGKQGIGGGGVGTRADSMILTSAGILIALGGHDSVLKPYLYRPRLFCSGDFPWPMNLSDWLLSL